MGARRLAVLGAVVALAVVLSGCRVLGIGPKGPKYPTHPVSVFHLSIGECLVPPSSVEAEVSTLSGISCNAPHTQQVYALVNDNAGDTYPGSPALVKFANAKCLQAFAGFVGVPYQQSSLFYTYLLPSVRSWAEGDRTISCIVTTTGQKLTQSVQNSKR